MVIDIDDENLSNHDDFIKICGKCEKVATHFCQTCNDNLCKFCIIDHYKNPDFTKITKWYQFSSWLLTFPLTDTVAHCLTWYCWYFLGYLLGSIQRCLPAAAWETLVISNHANENIDARHPAYIFHCPKYSKYSGFLQNK